MVGREITVGQYLAAETTLHGVDPRLKLVAASTCTVMIFIYGGWGMLAFACFTLVLLAAARLPLLPVLKSLRTVWVIVVVTFLLQLFLTPGVVIWQWGFLDMTDTGLYNGALFSSRVLMLVVLLATLSMTTSPLRLADGLESLLRPLKHVGVPVSRVTTVVSITLTFIPGMLERSGKLVRAQMARGADFESANLFRRVKDMVPIIVPLFVKVFHDADRLATAMDARAYAGGEGRTRLHPMKAGTLECVLTAAFVAASIAFAFL